MLANQKPANVERDILSAFVLSDKQKNGYITRSELVHYLTKGGEGMTKEEGL